MAELTREILIDATPETIWPLLVDPTRHVEWMGTEAELDPRPGGTYRVVVAGGYEAGGEFVEVVPHERVVFTFGWDSDDMPIPQGTTTVEITLEPDGHKTLVTLVHRGLPDTQVDSHGHGWAHYLDRLERCGVGVDPGPDRGPNAS